MEKHGVALEMVTEDVDSSELGKLISYIRGFASKLEAEKIKERTLRGRRARAKEGRVSGGFHTTYGYDYVPVSQKNGGRRAINESEAKWVRQIFEWLVDGGLATGAIRDRLIAAEAPTKTGKPWHRGTVIAIAKNPAYAGKTYAFTCAKGRARRKPREEWIELPGVTPPIISQEVFDAAQKQLQVNSAGAMRNTKREYLLRGHVRCRQSGHAYVGGVHGGKKADGNYTRIYTCCAKTRDMLPGQRCRNKTWNANRLETMIWTKLEEYMRTPELILGELEKQRQDANQLGVFESQLQNLERHLRAVDSEQHQLLQWALKGFPEHQVEAENQRLNKARETLTLQIAELEGLIKASREAVISLPNLERFIEFIHSRASALDFESKREVLDMLNITVWINGESVDLTGAVDPEGMIATTPS
jgi:site-specific DNA recombinase